jgi:hypothetical protein
MATTRQIAIHEAGHQMIARLQNIGYTAEFTMEGATTHYTDIPEELVADTRASLIRTLAGIAAEMEFTGIELHQTGFETDIPKVRIYLRWLGEKVFTNYLEMVRGVLRAHELDVEELVREMME